VVKKLLKYVKLACTVIGAVLLIAVGIGAFLAPTIMSKMEEAREAERGTIVQTSNIAYSDLIRVVSAPGTVQARNSVNITSRVSAKIIELPFEAGDKVREGDLVARLDSKDLEASLEAAKARARADEASLRSSEANHESQKSAILGQKAQRSRAIADFERSQMLFESGDVSHQDLDAARATMEQQESGYQASLSNIKGAEAGVEASRARVAVSQAEVLRAEENMSYTIIRSPIDGVITLVNSREGEVALGTIQNAGSVILIIADLSEMLVRAEIPETDVARIQEGQTVRIAINGFDDEEFKGTLRKMSLQSRAGTDGTNIFEAEIVLHLDDRRMFAGLTANVDIEVETIDGLLIVPSQAVLDKRYDDLPKEIREQSDVIDKSKTFAQVVFVRDKDSKAQLRPVKVEASNLRETAISIGLEEGDEIIIGPFRALQELTHGTGVKLEEDDDEKQDTPALADEDEEPAAESATVSNTS